MSNFKEIEKKFLELLDLIKATEWDNRIKLFNLAEKNGFHILQTGFYSPIPTISEFTDDDFSVNNNLHLDWNEKKQIKLLDELKNYALEFKTLVKEGKYEIPNPSFELLDATLYYCLIRHFKPKQIIEIGGGNSTIVAHYASLKNQNTIIKVIDPFIKEYFGKKLPESVEVIEKPIQKIPFNVFEQLTENDFFFIDSSHVSKTGSDVNFLYLEVLPKLNKGVIVHCHDIFLPEKYPQDWIKKLLIFWNEQYLLHAFMIGNKEFEILFGANFMSIRNQEIVKKWLDVTTNQMGLSFWMQKMK